MVPQQLRVAREELKEFTTIIPDHNRLQEIYKGPSGDANVNVHSKASNALTFVWQDIFPYFDDGEATVMTSIPRRVLEITSK